MRAVRLSLWIACACSVAGATLVPTPAAASAALHVESRIPLTGGSPFVDGCPVERPTQPGAEVEPHLVVDPRTPRRIMASWQQDRYSGPGALALGFSLSNDGGRTWERGGAPGLTDCPKAPTDRRSDPWGGIGPTGEVYLSALFGRPGDGALDITGVAVARKASGTAGWGAPVVVVDDGLLNDKPAVTTDPTRPGHAYVVWQTPFDLAGSSAIASVNAVIKLARTTDGGMSWSPPETVYTSPPDDHACCALLAVLPSRDVVIVFRVYHPIREQLGAPPTVTFAAVRSQDEGRSWSPPVTIASGADREPQDRDGNTIRTSASLPSMAVGPDGAISVTWAENESPTAARVLLARSADAGRTWSTPAHVAAGTAAKFAPAIAVMPDGTLGIAYADLRNDRQGDLQSIADYWLAHSHDDGRTWEEAHVEGPFDIRRAPLSGSSRFLGDYHGIAALPSGFGMAFAVAPPLARQGMSDVLFARARFGPPPRLRIEARPRRPRAGRRVRVRFHVTADIDGARVPIAAARVRFGRRTRPTNASGLVTFTTRLRSGVRMTTRVTARDLASTTLTLRVRRRVARGIAK